MNTRVQISATPPFFKKGKEIVTCKNCDSEKIIDVSGKCSDRFNACLQNKDLVENDYVDSNLGIGEGDYMEFEYCANCGMIQGKFPLDLSEFEDEEF